MSKKYTPKQKAALSDLVDSFRKVQSEIIPDYLLTNKKVRPRQYMMTQEQLEDYAYRTLKEALKEL